MELKYAKLKLIKKIYYITHQIMPALRIASSILKKYSEVFIKKFYCKNHSLIFLYNNNIPYSICADIYFHIK